MIRIAMLFAAALLASSSAVWAVDVHPLLDKWLLKSKRADLKSYTVISNEKYSTHLFIATSDARPTVQRDDERGLSSVAIAGKCQLFFYRTIARYASGGYYSEHAWSYTDPLDVKDITYSPEQHKVVVADRNGNAIKEAVIKEQFRSLFYCPCKAAPFKPSFGEKNTWPMPTETDGNPSDQLALDDLILTARTRNLKHFHVLVAKDKKAALVLATEKDTLTLESDDDGVSELDIEANALGVLIHSRYVCRTVPRYRRFHSEPVFLNRVRIDDDAEGLEIAFTAKDKRQKENHSDHWMSVLLGKPRLQAVQPSVGDFATWQLPRIIGN